MKILFGLIIIFLYSVPAWAECPPMPGKKEVRPSRVSPVRHMDRLRAKALAEGRVFTLLATYKILVIRVEFATDIDSQTTGNGRFDDTDILIVQSFMDKLASFYNENSYSKLTLNITITALVYSLSSKTMSVYGIDTPYDQYDTLVDDIVNTTDLSSDYILSNYDHFMIYHAGAGQESDVNNTTPNDIWSAYVPDLGLLGPINEATFVPEKENQNADPLGVICHEYGHQLGLPDIYYPCSTGQISTLGYWSLMDSGVWLPYPAQGGYTCGANPAHLDAWCKLDLGFITPQEIQGDASGLTFSPAETSASSFYKIIIPVADDPLKEFFLVEYRYRQSGAEYDKYIPGDGVLIYHIDNAIAQDATRRNNNDINSGYPHRGVDIEEADGTDAGVDFGRATDAFGTGINVFTNEFSRAYNGRDSGITLTMDVSGASATMNAVSISLLANMSIHKLINYPNPANGQTTFHVRLTRPYRTMELLIYTMAGDKVLQVKNNEFSFRSSKSSDNNWVYEHTWNGKNEEGDEVASGAYFYLLRVNNDKTRTSKLAIIK